MTQATTMLLSWRVQRQDALSLILGMLLVPSSMDCSEDICKRLLSGEIYGRAMLHHDRQDGYKAICPVTFMWRPVRQHLNVGTEDQGSDEIESSSHLRQLWIWMHPSAFGEGLDSLKLACQKMMNEKGVLVSCVSLDGKLGTLEVMGSGALQLLQKILRPITFSVEDCLKSRTGSTPGHKDGCEIQQKDILEKEECFSPGAAILLTVVDPRSACQKGSVPVPALPLTNDLRSSMEEKGKDNSAGNLLMEEEVLSTSQSKHDSNISLSNCKDLWDASIGVRPPVEEHILCLERHQKSLDFFCIKDMSSPQFVSTDEGHFSSFCPVLLLKNTDEAGLYTGWSIILPINWVKAFWIPLISGGAHAIGLREKHWVACDVGLPNFPSDFPDCNANSCLMEREVAAVDKTMENCSPAMRPFEIPVQLPWNSNWIACNGVSGEGSGIDYSSNICCNGDYSVDLEGKLSDRPLVNDGGSSEVLVARTSKMLTSFLKEISGDNLLLFPKGIDRPSFSHLMMKEIKISPSHLGTLMSDRRRLCYLRVVLHAFKEGVFEERAVVCAPCFSDITLLNSRLENNEDLQVPHAFVGSYFKVLPSGKWDFHLPEDPAAREAYRPPIGFVTTGFVRGSKRPAAVALCEAVLLARLRHEQWSQVPAKKRRKEIFVLVRNLRSTAYRLALATIVLEGQEEDVRSL
ncbi:ribonucleases P/MRP protein subunit POP1 isoform X2 [Beta vulgaris subsp. vulgaris]|uniref:ribonucleases P/MRP protein subunit POP1 isoform X2 n=1 Tax=Beta vulgaris subsp. vulgaris TaxID=3555 RepID=UPI00053F61AE|nr:ribonucleases P/MRP protein subunit POP1 isoform X2 [Beta vulgaris subsp. vulgaris]